SAPPHSGATRLYWGPPTASTCEHAAARPTPQLPAVAIVSRNPVQRGEQHRDNDGLPLLPCAAFRPTIKLTAAQPGSHTPLHISAASLRQWPADCDPQLLILGVSVAQRGDALQVLVARLAVCASTRPATRKLFQMTVGGGARGYFQLSSAARFNCRLFRPPHPLCDSPGFRSGAFEKQSPPAFGHPLATKSNCASGSPGHPSSVLPRTAVERPATHPCTIPTTIPAPDSCRTKRSLPEPPWSHPAVRQLAQTGSGNEPSQATWSAWTRAGIGGDHRPLRIVRLRGHRRRRRGRGTSISGYCVCVWGGPSRGSRLVARGGRRLAARSAPCGKRQVFCVGSALARMMEGNVKRRPLARRWTRIGLLTRGVLPPTNTSLCVEDLPAGQAVHSAGCTASPGPMVSCWLAGAARTFLPLPPGCCLADGGGDAGSRQLLGPGGPQIDKYVRINSESRLGSNSARVWLSARTISLCLLACLTAVNLYAA
uniref:G_PROTEIN_RECEP_F1_2 domain-containing protein n=1 Tax=Macrostomum lignano TaxID=282301 RepID=A0A1I8FHZ3_9PLAT